MILQRCTMKKKITCTYSPKYYGGAFDIDPYSFWTSEDFREFSDELESALIEKGFDEAGVDMELDDDYRTIHVYAQDEYDIDYETSFVPDMRRIRRPSDISKYKDEIVNDLWSQYCKMHESDFIDY